MKTTSLNILKKYFDESPAITYDVYSDGYYIRFYYGDRYGMLFLCSYSSISETLDISGCIIEDRYMGLTENEKIEFLIHIQNSFNIKINQIYAYNLRNRYDD